MNQESPSAEPFRAGRCLVAAASGFLFTLFAVGAWRAWQEISAQNWGDAGLEWLRWDYWARQMPLKHAAAGGLLTLALALAGEALRRAGVPPVTWVRSATAFFGRWPGFVLVLALAALPKAVAASTRPAHDEGAPNVVFVLIDTWRADHTSFLGYERETFPKLGALAEKGVIFENAIANSPWTKPTVATLFTGLIPSKHGAMSHMPADSGRRFVSMGRRHLTLAEAFRASGYDTVAFTHNANIRSEFGFDQGFGIFEVEVGRTEAMVEMAREWLNGYEDERPFLAYLHITDPHYPYDVPEHIAGTWDKSGSDFNLNYDVVKEFHDGKRQVTPEIERRCRDAYDEELLSTDTYLTPFLEEVLAAHPDTVVVVVGDHGEEFWDHGLVGHGHVLYDELMHVPFVLWAPGLGPQRVPNQVSLLDVFSTVLALTGLTERIETPADQGSSLLPILRGEESGDRPAPMETGGDGEPPWQLRGIRAELDGRLWKLVIQEEQEYRNKEQSFSLYDLDADPEERTNLAESHPEIVAKLWEMLKERDWYIAPKDLEGEVENFHDPELADNLHDLGYADMDTEDEESPGQ